MNRNMLITIPAVALILGALARPVLFPAPTAATYITARAAVEDLEETVLASGTLEAFKQVGVGTQVSGQVKSLKGGPGRPGQSRAADSGDRLAPAAELAPERPGGTC